MKSKYNVLKFNSGKIENIEDLISIEDPLEISIKIKEKDDWVKRIL
jgi:FdhD protein